MAWSKLDIIGAAFAEIGLGDYAFDATPAEKQAALSRLDALMARWLARGIQTGYVVENNPDADTISGSSGIAQELVRGVILNLAVDIAPSYGKQVLPHTAAAALGGYNDALSFTNVVPQMALNTTAVPIGAGYKYFTGQTTQPQPDPNPEFAVSTKPDFVIKQNDTAPAFVYVFRPLVDLTDATVTFTMRSFTGAHIINAAAATIVSAEAGVVSFDFTAAQTKRAGEFVAEFQVTFNDGSVRTYPNDNYLNIMIMDDL